MEKDMLKQGGVMGKEEKTSGYINTVYDESPYGIIVFSSSLEVLDWNPAVEKLIGLAKEACMGKKLLDVFPEMDASNTSQAHGWAIKGTMVVAEAIAGHFASGQINGLKVSVIVDKSGAMTGGSLILASQAQVN